MVENESQLQLLYNLFTDVLAADKASLEKSLSDLKDQHAAEVTKVKEEHQEEMKQLQERLHMEKEQEIEKGRSRGRAE